MEVEIDKYPYVVQYCAFGNKGVDLFDGIQTDYVVEASCSFLVIGYQLPLF